MSEWRNPMDMVIGEAEARLAAVKASYEAKLAARDAEWRAAVERVRARHPMEPHTEGSFEDGYQSSLDALLAEVPHDGQ